MTGSRDEWRFGDVIVETATFRVLRDGVPVHMEPRALEVLLYLIERRDRVVTKQELLDDLWKGAVVTENALTRAVAQIRKTLGDDLDSPRYIQTVPTRGYRFVAAINDVAPASAGELPVEPAVIRRLKRAPHRAWILTLILGVMGVLIAGAVAIDKARLYLEKKP